MRFFAVLFLTLALASPALGREPSLEEHAAAQESLSRVPERIPQPEPAVQVSMEETAPVVVDYPEPVYEEPGIGVPVAAGVPDSQS